MFSYKWYSVESFKDLGTLEYSVTIKKKLESLKEYYVLAKAPDYFFHFKSFDFIPVEK